MKYDGRLHKVKHDFMKHAMLLKEIKGIKKELAVLRTRQEYVEDSILSADDVKALKSAREDLKVGKTSSLTEVKRRLGA
mgnify:FL=1